MNGEKVRTNKRLHGTVIGHRYLKLSLLNDRPTHSAHDSRPIIQRTEHTNAANFSWFVRMTSLVTEREPNKLAMGCITEDFAQGNDEPSKSGKCSTFTKQ